MKIDEATIIGSVSVLLAKHGLSCHAQTVPPAMEALKIASAREDAIDADRRLLEAELPDIDIEDIPAAWERLRGRMQTPELRELSTDEFMESMPR